MFSYHHHSEFPSRHMFLPIEAGKGAGGVGARVQGGRGLGMRFSQDRLV